MIYAMASVACTSWMRITPVGPARLAEVRMVTSWYDSGVRLTGTAATAATATAPAPNAAAQTESDYELGVFKTTPYVAPDYGTFGMTDLMALAKTQVSFSQREPCM